MDDNTRTTNQPSVEDEVHRVLRAGEQAQNRAADAASDTANTVKDQVSSAAENVTDKVKDVVQDLRTKDAGEVASDLKDKAVEVGSQVQDKAGELASQAADKTDDAMTATGQGMQTLAQTVRDKAPSGTVGDIADTAATALEKGGAYLEKSDPAAVRSDLEEIIRRNPIPALLVGLGIGFLLARSLRR